MRFRVIPNSSSIPDHGTDVGYLWTDNWNDWYEFRTLYVLTYFDVNGGRHDLGGVKIGQFGMEVGQARPAIPAEFPYLSDSFFSLGQDVSYYSAISELGDETSSALLQSLRHVVADEQLYLAALNERVTGVSLLRNVASTTIEGQFRRVLKGGAPLTEFSFKYLSPAPEGAIGLEIGFEVEPMSYPPTNVHVIIGRNGVGKSHMLHGMSRAIVYENDNPSRDGQFIQDHFLGPITSSPFAGVVSVTFSAFDDFETLRPNRDKTKSPRYKNVGLRREGKNDKGIAINITRDPDDLTSEFTSSAKSCVRGAAKRRWLQALTTLETDTIFAEIGVAELVQADEASFGRQAADIFRKLSSGHKIVLLTITQLVEAIEEKTLVLMDEPEAHLHPPLLSAFIRALSDLLTDRNGVAVVATHSPVVLQEVPRRSVWKLARHGNSIRAFRPEIETFGENVGVLTSEVFGLEVTRSGFHKMLESALVELGDADLVNARFGSQIGSEGRAILSALLAASRDRTNIDVAAKPPTVQSAAAFAVCISRIRDLALKRRFTAAAPEIETANQEYLLKAGAGDLHLFKPAGHVGHVTTDEMVALYDFRMAAKGSPGRTIYDTLKQSPQDRCPMCDHRDVSTLDHFLPKTIYPALAVNPLNLVPACAECNKTKAAFAPKYSHEVLLHPYFDDVSAETWLFGKVVAAAPAAVVFEVIGPDTWDNGTTARVRNHFEAFGLARLYSVQTARELSQIRKNLGVHFRSGGAHAVHTELTRQWESRKEVSFNSWQTAAYRAFASDEWFCSGGFAVV